VNKKLFLAGCLGIALALSVTSCGAVDKKNNSSNGEIIDGVHVIPITLKNYAFSPRVLELAQGDEVELILTSTDGPHDFTVDELGHRFSLLPGQTRREVFTADTIGEFRLICTIPPHESLGMWGIIRVR